jgi:hypothetical protein
MVNYSPSLDDAGFFADLFAARNIMSSFEQGLMLYRDVDGRVYQASRHYFSRRPTVAFVLKHCNQSDFAVMGNLHDAAQRCL